MARPRVLITNDDGISAPGLAALASAADDIDVDVIVVAPAGERSGSSSAIGSFSLDSRAAIEVHRLEGIDVEAYSVDAPPAVCVFTAALGGFGEPPDIVLAGINPGANTGRSTLHSGTVGAVLTAANLGLKGAAFSTDVEWALHDPDAPVPVADRPVEFGAVASSVPAVLDYLIEAPEKTVLNINGPEAGPGVHKGFRTATLAPFGRVRAVVKREGDYFRLDLEQVDAELPPDSDSALVEQGYLAVSALSGVTALDEDIAGKL